jgi:peptidoglycan/xylan/chitin deacetylase (PgdA/CDA1 family)
MVDGGLLSRGVRVHRADPWLLPPRPSFGSVDADTLAVAGATRLPELPRLVLTEGSLTGRVLEADDPVMEETATAPVPRDAPRQWSRLEPAVGNAVALTFDDGPNPPCTGAILDVLDRYDVRATFFCVGLQARAHPEELARMAGAGHAVGNHTWSHPLLPDLTPEGVAAQVDRTSQIIASGTGGRRPDLFRPPYGVLPHGTVPSHAATAMDKVFWDVDTEDWAMPGPEAIARAVLQQARPGSIVLMHDGGGDRSQTVTALPVIIEGLLDRGFALVAVDPRVSRVDASDQH